MLDGQKIVVVMPAYNAAPTLQRTYDEVVAQGIVDLVIVVDHASHDDTVAIARTLERVQVEVHPENRGYGANQKNLLSPRTGRGCGHYHYDSPRLSVHAAVNPGDGGSGGKRTLSLRAWFAHSWRCAAWRYAFVEIHLEPVFDAC